MTQELSISVQEETLSILFSRKVRVSQTFVYAADTSFENGWRRFWTTRTDGKETKKHDGIQGKDVG